MQVFVVGGEGFVGSAYVRLFNKLGMNCVTISRANYADFAGQSCDLLINSNGNSKKFLADKDPKAEFEASVFSVVRTLADFDAKTYVFLSTGDVYPRQDSPEITREDLDLDTRQMSRYGLHKFTAENMVRALHPDFLIMRMGGFVGPGLRKNAIFDMLNDQPVWLDLASELQFISTDMAAKIVWTLIERGIRNETVNLAAKGLTSLSDIHQRLGASAPVQPDARKVRFEISTEKLERLYGADLPRTADEVGAFLTEQGR